MSDPLTGYRNAISRGDCRRLVFPADKPCPVKPGDRFHLRSCEIVIEKVGRKLVKGRQPEWHATFVRIDKEQVYMLRRTPPTHAGTEQDLNLDITDTERARRDGNYTASRFAALENEPESVGPDWEDKGMAERELRRQEERKARITAERSDAEVDKAAARLKQVGRTLGRSGHDLTPLLDEIYERLAREEQEAA